MSIPVPKKARNRPPQNVEYVTIADLHACGGKNWRLVTFESVGNTFSTMSAESFFTNDPYGASLMKAPSGMLVPVVKESYNV